MYLHMKKFWVDLRFSVKSLLKIKMKDFKAGFLTELEVITNTELSCHVEQVSAGYLHV